MAEREARLILRIKQVGKEALDSVSESISSLKVHFLVAAAAIVGFGIKAVMSFREAELASNQLDQALAQQGIYTRELSQEYKKLSEELQRKSQYDDDAIKTAMASVQMQIGQEKVTRELTVAILDLATAQKMDLNSAAQLVGKSIGSSTNALARYGVEINAAGSKSEKTAQLIEQLNQKFGGQSEAAAQGLGSLALLKNTMGDFAEVVGKTMSPYIVLFTQKFVAMTEAMQTNQSVILGVDFVMRTLSNTLSIIVATGQITINTFNAMAASLTAAGLAITGNFKEAGNLLKVAWSDTATDIKQNLTDLYTDLEEINTNRITKDAEIESARGQKLLEQSAINNELIKAQESQHQLELATMRGVSDEALALQVLESQRARLIEEQENEKDHTKKLEQELKKRELDKKISDERYKLSQTALLKFNKWVDENHIKDKQDTFSRIETLTDSNNQVLVSIGRAAALANIAISTAEGVARALGAFPPPVNFAMAAAVGAAGAVQSAKVMGVKLAEGGIVQASPGGTAAIIGEAGRDEAVIPLGDDRASSMFGSQNNININVYGGLLGDESSARELALAIDQELYKLKRNNESMIGA